MPSRPRGICPACGQDASLKKDGSPAAHYPKGGGPWCYGNLRVENLAPKLQAIALDLAQGDRSKINVISKGHVEIWTTGI